MALSEEIKLEREKQKQLKSQIKEFAKKCFVYRANDPEIPEKVKQELTKLGAFKPFYADHEAERSIKFSQMLNSEVAEVRKIVLEEIGNFFAVSLDEANSLLTEIRTYQHNLEARMQKMKEAKELKKYE